MVVAVSPNTSPTTPTTTLLMLLLPFDAHNHVQLSPVSALEHVLDSSSLKQALCGMAVMSTHPRDFDAVLELSASTTPFKVVPCLGVHPWFLHELEEEEEDWCVSDNNDDDDDNNVPKWVASLDDLLASNPHAKVGEIGLDGFHFDPVTKDLTTPLERQIEAFRHQLNLATKHQRPVSIHCVRAVGKLMDTIQQVYRENQQKLPPKLYFHAFGGKASTATQICKTLEKSKQRKNNSSSSSTERTRPPTKVYFGFAPVVNFQSPKTFDVIRTVGLDRLVLETDHEDVRKISESMKMGVKEIAKALGVTEEALIRATNDNVRDLYGLEEKI